LILKGYPFLKKHLSTKNIFNEAHPPPSLGSPPSANREQYKVKGAGSTLHPAVIQLPEIHMFVNTSKGRDVHVVALKEILTILHILSQFVFFKMREENSIHLQGVQGKKSSK
jgi:hypothetical protein